MVTSINLKIKLNFDASFLYVRPVVTTGVGRNFKSICRGGKPGLNQHYPQGRFGTAPAVRANLLDVWN